MKGRVSGGVEGVEGVLSECLTLASTSVTNGRRWHLACADANRMSVSSVRAVIGSVRARSRSDDETRARRSA